jgi:hypothetical protein
MVNCHKDLNFFKDIWERSAALVQSQQEEQCLLADILVVEADMVVAMVAVEATEEDVIILAVVDHQADILAVVEALEIALVIMVVEVVILEA